MPCTAPLYPPCIMKMISNFTIFFVFQIFIFKFFFTNVTLEFSYGSSCSFFNNFIFFFLKLIKFIACFLKDSQNFFMQPVLYIHHVVIFYASNWRCCRNWKTWWNVLAYFCCKWIFRIIFASINLYYSLKICLINKWCFIRFLILIKF